MGLSTFHISPFGPEKGDFDLGKYYGDHRATLTRVERSFVYMADGLVSDSGGVFRYKPQEAYVELALGGSLVIAKPVRPDGGDFGEGQNGGLRGRVVGFSSGSRRRLMRIIASVERQQRPVFVTMTYPDSFPEDAKKWKRDIDVFGKRLRRKFPVAGFVWRVEFKERKTGEKTGEIAPHFHLLVYGANYHLLRAFVPGAWYKVVGSGEESHLKASTRVEHIYSFGGIMRYVGKYISKEDEFPPEWCGRVWGVVGREQMPWAVRVTISLSEAEGISLVRLGRKMLRLNGKTLTFGLTWIVNAERILDYLEVIMGLDDQKTHSKT